MIIESEMKFSLAPGLRRRLLKSALLKRSAHGEAITRQLNSTYFDTRQHALRKGGAALRVRQADDIFEQTVKLSAPGPLGMQNCEERTVALSDGRPDLALFDRALLRRLSRRGHHMKLLPVFTTEVQRTSLVLSHGKTHFELALDSGRLRSHGHEPRTLPVCEVEFELHQGQALPMLDFILTLCEEIELQPLFLSKAQRGYALARPALRPKGTKARPVELRVDMSAGEAFQQIAGEALRHLQSNQQPTIDGQPGGIHQARVAIRRIRAALRAFKKILPYDKRKAFNGEFRWLQTRLAPARDWHVFLSETLPQIGADPRSTQIDLDRLRKLAVRERRRATEEARELLRGRRYTRLILQFQRWLLALESDHSALFAMPLKPFAAGVLDRTHRELLLDTRPLSRMSEEERHSLRKRGKKARYAIEFFSGLWQDPPVDSYLVLMETIQDRLGEANDSVVARMLMASLSPRVLADASLLRVQSWSKDRELQCIRAGQPVWRRMQRAIPFWD